MKIIYSYNKAGEEAAYWERELTACSTRAYELIPFNHGVYTHSSRYVRAQLLDNLYYNKDSDLLRMYSGLMEVFEDHNPDVLLVDNKHAYHPEFLLKLKIHKVLRITDGPMTAYDRDFAYLHAYDQVLYHSPGYSEDLDIRSKLQYCGAHNIDFWPLGLFDRMYDVNQTEDTIMSHERDIDVVFVGATHPNKMPLITQVKKAFGKRCVLHGLSNWKRNIYYMAKYRFPYWISPIEIDQYRMLYQRSKIGFNVHNRGKYTLGGYRFFDLPGNGVMQISDGDEYLSHFYDVGNEVIGYSEVDELIDKIKFYLLHDHERERIALNGYRRVMKDYKMDRLIKELSSIISTGMSR